MDYRNSEFAYSKYFALFGALLIEKELLIVIGQLVGTGLKGNPR